MITITLGLEPTDAIRAVAHAVYALEKPDLEKLTEATVQQLCEATRYLRERYWENRERRL